MHDARIAIIQSKFNNEITDSLTNACISRFKQHGFKEENLEIFHVPGAVELPLASQMVAKKRKVDAVICIGAVIKGDTDHYQYVCEQVSYGCQKVALNVEIPIIFGVLTVASYDLAVVRAGEDLSKNKGAECADAAVEMVKFISNVNGC